MSKKILTSSFFLVAGDVDDFRLELDEFLWQVLNKYKYIKKLWKIILTFIL